MDDGDDDDTDDDATDDDTDDDLDDDDDTDDDNDHKNGSYTAAGAAPGPSVPCSFSRVSGPRVQKRGAMLNTQIVKTVLLIQTGFHEELYFHA